jgi:hypothetical protein
MINLNVNEIKTHFSSYLSKVSRGETVIVCRTHSKTFRDMKGGFYWLEHKRFSGFLIALLALTPNLVIEVYFGHVGKHAARLAGSNVRTAHLHDLVIIGGLVVCIVVMVFVSRMARKAVMQAVAETEKAVQSTIKS